MKLSPHKGENLISCLVSMMLWEEVRCYCFREWKQGRKPETWELPKHSIVNNVLTLIIFSRGWAARVGKLQVTLVLPKLYRYIAKVTEVPTAAHETTRKCASTYMSPNVYTYEPSDFLTNPFVQNMWGLLYVSPEFSAFFDGVRNVCQFSYFLSKEF